MVDVLHINDNCLLLQKDSRQISSQGYAWFSGDQVFFDLSTENTAVKRCRLSPQEINNRYWMQCDQSAITANGAGMRHAADLVWQHLNQLKHHHGLNELVLVVPSHYQAENLQLLLGVAKACDLEIKALLNKASLALFSGNLPTGDYTHLDVQLHQTVRSKLTIDNDSVKLGEVDLIQDVGIHLMQETLLKGLQNNFIQNDRFDPLHDAHTEQQLFDQVPKISEQIAASGKANIGVEHQGKLHTTSVDAKEWQGLLSNFSNKLAKASSTNAFVDLNSAFGSAALTDVGTIMSSTIKAGSNGAAVVYQTDLALTSARPTTEPLARERDAVGKNNVAEEKNTELPASTATHLLSAGKAVALNKAHISMQDNGLSVSLDKTANLENLLNSGKLFVLNDEGRTQVKPNDRIGSHLVDGVITVIQVI